MNLKLFFLSIVIIGLFSPSKSMAQIAWTKHPTPVLSRSATFPDWKALATGDACVIIDNDTLKMWYSGVGWQTGSDPCPRVRIGYAWSLDGMNWNEYPGNPVLNISSDTSKFDSDGVETPTVIKDLLLQTNAINFGMLVEKQNVVLLTIINLAMRILQMELIGQNIQATLFLCQETIQVGLILLFPAPA